MISSHWYSKPWWLHSLVCKKACAHLNLMHMFSHCKQDLRVCVGLCSGTDKLSFLDVNLWRHLPQRMRSIVSKRESTGSFALHPTSVAFPPGVCGHLHLHLFLLLLFVGLSHTQTMHGQVGMKLTGLTQRSYTLRQILILAQSIIFVVTFLSHKYENTWKGFISSSTK